MEAETLFPKRNGQTDGSFRKLKPVEFATNFYPIILDEKRSKICQYSFDLPEHIPKDSSTVYDRCIRMSIRQMRNKIGYLAHSGQIIWGALEIKSTSTVICKLEENSLEATIKPIKVMNLSDLDSQVLLQILNSHLKNILQEQKMSELGKPGTYFEKEFKNSEMLANCGLQVICGFDLTFVQMKSEIALQIDSCTRVLQSRNLLEIFDGKSMDYNKNRFEGTTVITKYGKLKTYSIEKIEFSMSPCSLFHHKKKDKEITFIEYYKEAYGITIRNTKQPLLKVIGNKKRCLDPKGKTINEIIEYSYLIPELVSPTGLTDEQREDFNVMKFLAPFTKLSPDQRMDRCEELIGKIGPQLKMFTIKQSLFMRGNILPKPFLRYHGQTEIQPDYKGNVKYRGVINEPSKFNDWVFMYSGGGNYPKKCVEDAGTAVNVMKMSAGTYGISLKEPGFIEIRSNHVEDWKKELQKDFESNGVPQIVVLFLNQNEERMYSELKRYLTNVVKVPCQCIRKKTLLNGKGALSAASKILIQMSVKIGCTAWQVLQSHEYFDDKSVMYCGISISKGSTGYTLSFVGTLNSNSTKIYCDCRTNFQNKENIPESILEEMFINWAKTFYLSNKRVPNVIIVYREGLSIPQAENQLPKFEIPALNNMIKIIGLKTKTKDYNPEISIVLVNKKISTRFFKEGRDNYNSNFLHVDNPDSGSIIAESLSDKDRNEFLLASQFVTQGTCTPTLFRVAYSRSKMPQEALIQFTFGQCFNYYNWEGAVRVPACLQNADKLAKLVGQYIKENIQPSVLNKQYFFL